MTIPSMTTVDRLRQVVAETIQIDVESLQGAIGCLVVATSAEHPEAPADARSVRDAAAGVTVLLADRIPAGDEAKALASEIARQHGRGPAETVLGEQAEELLGIDGKLSNYTDPNQVYETGSDDTFWNSKVIRVGERFNVQVFDADGDRRPDREDSFADQALAIAFADKSVQRYSGREVAERIVPANSLVEYRMLLDRWRTADGTAKSSGITDSIRAAAVAEVEAVAEALRLSPFGLDEKGRVAERKMTNYIEHEPNSALEALCQETGTTPEDWNSMDGPETGVGVERWYVHTADGREAYTVDDQGSFTIEVSVPDRKMENPQERYRLSAMDEGNDHYSVLDTKTQLYWSSEGWQRPDSGWASVLTRSEAARKAYELNRKLSKVIYCVAYTDSVGNGVDRWDLEGERDKAMPNYKDATPFQVQVSDCAGDDDIEDAIDVQWSHIKGRQLEKSDIVSVVEPPAPRQDDRPSP